MGETPDDDELLTLTASAGRGDRRALEDLLARYTPELRARESSVDLVQSVCREVLEHAERFRHPSEAAFKRWLYTTALRKIKNRHAYDLANKRDVLRNATPLDDDAAARELLDHYRSFSTPSVERVEVAFEQLSDEQREVITLAHMVGLSRAEIAAQMNKTEGAVRVLLQRALAKVSDLLSDDDE
jgi:RNA polymerase sigma-70 factor (ECF subfamily)